MFGEYDSESPRLPSVSQTALPTLSSLPAPLTPNQYQPWRTATCTRQSLESPSPLSLRTPTSTPGTPTGYPPAPPALAVPSNRRRHQPPQSPPSAFDFDAAFDVPFDALSLDDGDPLGQDDLLRPVVAAGGLDPEVDKSGHIEYKLKLPSPTPMRLAKLQTQLKWRLVEGGGVALYELGVLDDGTLVGLAEEEMEESLATLGKMLRGLGGGQVRVGRVVRIGARSDTFDSNGTIARRGSVTDQSDESEEEGRSGGRTFASFDVEGEEPDLDYDPGEPLPLLGTVIPPPPVPTGMTTQPIAIPPPHPFAERTAAERAAIKRNKRDARRIRRESEGDLYPPRRPYDPSRHHFHNPRRPPNLLPDASISADDPTTPLAVLPPIQRSPKAPTHHHPHQAKAVKGSAKKLSQSAPSVGSVATGICRKPRLAAAGEKRFVVEAIVLKKGKVFNKNRPGKLRQGSGDEEDEEDETNEEEEGEGWKYLDFDWMGDENVKGAGRRG
ncbi:hypothetical protein P7C70_g904, partial [Phenoliferia sp. Uapishka_3]